MIGGPARLWLFTAPTDLRKSYDGLSGLVRSSLGQDPLRGDGFVFVNRRRTQLKLLYFDAGGYCIWSKRLERGEFGVRHGTEATGRRLGTTEFQALIEGLDLEIRRRRRRWQPPVDRAA